MPSSGHEAAYLQARALLGWMKRDEAQKFLMEDCVFENPVSAVRAEEIWLEYKHKVEALPVEEPRPADIVSMSAADIKAIRKFRSRFPNEQSVVDIVRLNPMELLVHQLWVSPSLAEPYMVSAAPAKWTQTALLDPPSAAPSKPRREGNAMVFDLPHPEFLLVEREGADALLQVFAPQAFVTVAFHAGRAVLLTGYHRTFALAQQMMGNSNAPRGVLFGVSNALELLGSDADDVRTMMTSARPPRLADFFNPELCLSVRMRKRHYRMRVSYEIAEGDGVEAVARAASRVLETPPVKVSTGPVRNRASAQVAFESAVRLHEEGRFQDAIQNYAEILNIDANNPQVHASFSATLLEAGRLEEAKAHAERAVYLDPANATAQSNLGAVLQAVGNIDEARQRYRQALAVDPENTVATINLGIAHSVAGDLDAALSLFRQAISRKPDCVEAYRRIAEIMTFSPHDREMAALERLASSQSLSEKDLVSAHFALAKALEDCGEFDRAFEHFRIGNEMQRRRVPYEESRERELVEALKELVSREAVDKLRGGGHPSQLPVFVVGMPRSGTTLIEQILASHPQVRGAGELVLLGTVFDKAVGSGAAGGYLSGDAGLDPDSILRLAESYLNGLPPAPGALRIVDKMPGNFLFAGLVHLMFPNARIIHAVRDPADTCFSCYATLFRRGQYFTYNLAELGRYYQLYSATMNHWRSVLPSDSILDIRYEDLVENFDAETKRLLDFCGLTWDDSCRAFYRTNRAVSTASIAQVRRPLYRTSIGRWRRFEKDLEPLILELGMGKPVGAASAA